MSVLTMERRRFLRENTTLPFRFSSQTTWRDGKNSDRFAEIKGVTQNVGCEGLGLFIPSTELTQLDVLDPALTLQLELELPTTTCEVHVRPVRIESRFDQGVKKGHFIGARITAISHADALQELLRDVETASSPLACIHEMFEAQVRRTPDRVAVIFEDQRLSYNELNCRANQLAHHLKGHGVGPDKLVGIYMERSLEMLIAMLGIMKAGGAYVPLDPMSPPVRLAFMLEDTNIKTLLTQKRFLGKLPTHAIQIFCIDDWDEISKQSEKDINGEVKGEDLAYVIYTSGSTGTPKGVMIPHRAVSNYLSWMQDAFPFSDKDRMLLKAPFNFDASVWEFYSPLVWGAQLYIAQPNRERDPEYLRRIIKQEQITVLQFVPSLLRLFLESSSVSECTSLSRVFSGGEPLSIDLQNRFFARLPMARLYNLYGPTETTIYSTFWFCKQDSERKIVPIGKPIRATQVYVLDDNLQPVSSDDVGELHIGGIGVARGYFNRPELSEERFIPNPFCDKSGEKIYKTGGSGSFYA